MSMKKAVSFLLITALLWAGVLAANATAPYSIGDKKHTAKYIRKRIGEIYRCYENPQYDEYGMRIIERGDLNETFCSTQYKALLQKAYEISEDEMILDYDHWTYSQDDNQFICKPGKVENITDSTAIAYVKAKNFDEEYMIILSLVFERGDWYVDDFLSLDGDSEKAYLERQIRERETP